MNAKERANVLSLCLDIFSDIEVSLESISFDGARVNINMCEELGASFVYGEHFQPWFLNPHTNEKFFIFFDIVHIIKLIRNTFGEKGILYSNDGKIKFSYIVKLHELQEEMGLRLGNKLTKRHTNFSENKMKVSLATQLLSKSVASSLQYCEQNINGFEESKATAIFCEKCNAVFDMLNVRSQFSNKLHGQPLNDKNCKKKLMALATKMEEYIVSSKDHESYPIILRANKTEFIGFLVALNNIFYYFEYCKEKGFLIYVLSFKFSQDHILKIFFLQFVRGLTTIQMLHILLRPTSDY